MKVLQRMDKKNLIILGILIVAIIAMSILSITGNKNKNNKSINEETLNQMVESKLNSMEDGTLDSEVVLTNASTESNENSSEEQKDNKKTSDINDKGAKVREDFINKIISQLGQTADASGNTTYGTWWGSREGDSSFNNAPWCDMFLAWCANEAKVAEDTVGYYAACTHHQEFYENKGTFHLKQDYTPVRGDIIFFEYNSDGKSDHNGVVEKVSNNEVVALEGNADGAVARVTYSITDDKVLGYGQPDYANNEENLKKSEVAVASADTAQPVVAPQETAVSSTGGQAQKIIDIAASQIGTYEGADGWTKYGQWYQDNIACTPGFSTAAWCAMFVSWCANEAGISSDIIKPYASCSIGESDAADRGVWHPKESGYTPKKGDIIFFINGSHTGLVEYYENGVVHTIEGNYLSNVSRAEHAIDSYKISGYASPNYQ